MKTQCYTYNLWIPISNIYIHCCRNIYIHDIKRRIFIENQNMEKVDVFHSLWFVNNSIFIEWLIVSLIRFTIQCVSILRIWFIPVNFYDNLKWSRSAHYYEMKLLIGICTLKIKCINNWLIKMNIHELVHFPNLIVYPENMWVHSANSTIQIYFIIINSIN